MIEPLTTVSGREQGAQDVQHRNFVAWGQCPGWAFLGVPFVVFRMRHIEADTGTGRIGVMGQIVSMLPCWS